MSRSCRGRMFSYVVKGIPFSIQILQEGNPESFFFFDFFNSNKALAFLVNIASMESLWVTTNGTTIFKMCVSENMFMNEFLIVIHVQLEITN